MIAVCKWTHFQIKQQCFRKCSILFCLPKSWQLYQQIGGQAFHGFVPIVGKGRHTLGWWTNWRTVLNYAFITHHLSYSVFTFKITTYWKYWNTEWTGKPDKRNLRHFCLVECCLSVCDFKSIQINNGIWPCLWTIYFVTRMIRAFWEKSQQ